MLVEGQADVFDELENVGALQSVVQLQVMLTQALGKITTESCGGESENVQAQLQHYQ